MEYTKGNHPKQTLADQSLDTTRKRRLNANGYDALATIFSLYSKTFIRGLTQVQR